ncbi:MAG TPA: hypothetical protein VGN26_23205 [Armatimonadota bacterium]
MQDPRQTEERTAFQTGGPYRDEVNSRADVAIVYGIDKGMPERVKTWRDRGYRVHLMTGVAWGEYQDYLYGRFDGINHEDEAQTERDGRKIGHGGDVWYMCPGINYGKFLCVGVQLALDAGVEAVHLEEPEFWVRAGYSEGFKREWKDYYKEDWIAPHTSPDAQWRASKLKYYLYRRALQQVFAYIQDYNKRTGKKVRCYVPTHSLINYAHWNIVSPESSLAQIDGCDGYIAQVWTGTSRTPNVYRGALKERTFETAFLEYGTMQNLVRATGRGVWYLNDPIEDNPNHDWGDYQRNWESTLVASLLQPEVWQYEIMPWPDRIFLGRYPDPKNTRVRIPIPAGYATELQTVFRALTDMKQRTSKWDAGTQGIGVVVSDSLMFQRGEPRPLSSDGNMGHFYGLALPLVKRGMPVEPVQLETMGLRNALSKYRLLLMTYQGQKPLSPEVHAPLAKWVKDGGVLCFLDDDKDAYNQVRDWWNQGSNHYATPRQHLFQELGLGVDAAPGLYQVGKGKVLLAAVNPTTLAGDPKGDLTLMEKLREATKGTGIRWKECSHLLLRRGRYIAAAGMDESVDVPAKTLQGRFVDLFDPELKLEKSVTLTPGKRTLLLDVDKAKSSTPQVLASACQALKLPNKAGAYRWQVEGMSKTNATVLLSCKSAPKSVTLDGAPVSDTHYDAQEHLLWVRFPNEARARELSIAF